MGDTHNTPACSLVFCGEMTTFAAVETLRVILLCVAVFSLGFAVGWTLRCLRGYRAVRRRGLSVETFYD